MHNVEKIAAFIAYPSRPKALVEVIQDAFGQLGTYNPVEFTTWETLRISGRLIISEILNKIDSSDLFIADITFHNPNVLFELGYATAKKKRVWLLHDSSSDEAKAILKRVGITKALGYSEYTNVDQVISKYNRDIPHADLGSTLDSVVDLVSPNVRINSHLLYLKAQTNTEASKRLTTSIKKLHYDVISSDPEESSVESLSWYVNHVLNTYAVLCHLDSDAISNARATVARYSFLAGLAYGLGKEVFLLAHEPYECPLDYAHLLKIHSTAKECEGYFCDWISNLRDGINEIENRAIKKKGSNSKKAILSQIYLGEHVAENETDQLEDYFVQTGPFHEAMKSTLMLFVGRKGTGKTANLLQLQRHLMSNRANHVCTICPSSYNTEVILSSLKRLCEIAEEGGVYESLWKYLVYSQICLSICDRLNAQAPYSLTSEEHEFLSFCEAEELSAGADFAGRMERRVQELLEFADASWDGTQKVRFAEQLHDGPIPKMRQAMSTLLGRRKRVILLIDNLDKAWRQRADLQYLCSLLLGLLSVAGNIRAELSRNDSRYSPIQLSLVLFMRSDIYAFLEKMAREPDKLPVSRIIWDDKATLLSILEERVTQNSDLIADEDVWGYLFPDRVHNLDSRQYLVTCVFPRPRDIIVLAKSALSRAISRGHETVTEDDLIDARKEYSTYAYQSVIAEDANGLGSVEKGIDALLGAPAVVTITQIRERFACVEIPDKSVDHYIRVMTRLSVLGPQIGVERYEFVYDERDYDKLHRMSAAFREMSEREQCYRIHPALCPMLEIDDWYLIERL